MIGPDFEQEIVEETRERVVVKINQCSIWNSYKYHGVQPDILSCEHVCKTTIEEGLKAVNPQLTTKYTKAMPRGDPFCKHVIEFKEE
jgi:hypothetical protein